MAAEKPNSKQHPSLIASKAFCASLKGKRTTVKRGGSTAEEFLKQINKYDVSWVDFAATDTDEAEAAAVALGFSRSLVPNLLKEQPSAYEDYDTELGILIPALWVRGLDVIKSPLLILIRKGLIATIHSAQVTRFRRSRRYAETLLRWAAKGRKLNDKMTLVLSRLIDENNDKNFDHLRAIEKEGDRISNLLIDMNGPRAAIAPEIHGMKSALLEYLDALWSSVDVLNTLRFGDPELLSDDERILESMGALVQSVNYQINLAEHLSDVLASGLEVLQSIYNNQLQQLNNRMAMVVAYLTILGTAVLVPNTLATIMSSSAYNLGPDDAVWYTLLMLASTVVATTGAYLWVKRSGWLNAEPK
ncbi:TPA: magnesium transporter CorA [Candidatus Micrarchaeota archaeon]|nr:magnesium transporter CorA [Candidatus Micrarchaeota archaeon]